MLKGRDDIAVLRAVENHGVGPWELAKGLKKVWNKLYMDDCIEEVYQLTAKGNAMLAQYEMEKDKAEDKQGEFR